MIKTYYSLIKPGIVYGNALTAAAGFFLASRGSIDWILLAAMLAGLSGIVASGCVFNNYIDRDIDAHMQRTKDRALVRRLVSVHAAIIYAAVLGFGGGFMLWLYTNQVTLTAAVLGFLIYIGPYSMWAKRRTPFATHVGSIAGAIPPVVGYCAVTGRLDAAALILFLALSFWQLAHFFAIALRRLDDYTAASVPVWPAAKGVHSTVWQMVYSIAAFNVATLSLTVFGFTGYSYAAVMLLLGVAWLGLSLKGFWASDAEHWAKQVFLFSLVVIIGFCADISITSGLHAI